LWGSVGFLWLAIIGKVVGQGNLGAKAVSRAS